MGSIEEMQDKITQILRNYTKAAIAQITNFKIFHESRKWNIIIEKWYYSGKKKQHTIKNNLVINATCKSRVIDTFI